MVTDIRTFVARRHVRALSLRRYFPEQWDGVGSDFTIAQHVDDVISLIEALDGKPAGVMGHSRGGHIAFRAARQRSDLVRKLVLAEPGGHLDASLSPDRTRSDPPGRPVRLIPRSQNGSPPATSTER
jgi:pimeloyl-ACP methyl ester carboxylesterase